MTDLSKAILDTQFSAYKNNSVYIGALTISGNVTAGTNTQIFTVPLRSSPDLVDIQFNGPNDSVFAIDPRPANGWFKQGAVYVPVAGADIQETFHLYGSINGNNLVITAVTTTTTVGTNALTATNFSYRLIDYSVF